METNSQSLVITETTGTLQRASRLVSSFLSGKSHRTLLAYRADLEGFRAFVKAEDLDQAARILLSRGHGEANGIALDYRTHLVERGLQSATVNRRLAALRSLVKLARTLGMVPWELEVQSAKVEAYRDTRGPGRTGFSSLLDEASKTRNAKKAVRDRSILRLLHVLALRRGELAGLDLEGVDLTHGTVAVLGKGRAQKELLTLPEPTKAALHEWIAIRGSDPGPLFVNLDRAGKGDGRLTGTGLYLLVRKLWRKTGQAVRPHGLPGPWEERAGTSGGPRGRRKMENGVRLTGLWKNKTKDGKTYLSGNRGTAKLLVLPNDFKKTDSHPDYNVLLIPQEKKDRPVTNGKAPVSDPWEGFGKDSSDSL